MCEFCFTAQLAKGIPLPTLGKMKLVKTELQVLKVRNWIFTIKLHVFELVDSNFNEQFLISELVVLHFPLGLHADWDRRSVHGLNSLIRVQLPDRDEKKLNDVQMLLSIYFFCEPEKCRSPVSGFLAFFCSLYNFFLFFLNSDQVLLV